ncbi:MAG: hypothetical protein P1V20_31460 [Verrucomicrobiales bacterium]|nr:hypothetical protein [Verrucomicrobiales bacterium]
MPTFQFLLHTAGIRVEFEDDPVPAVGFYTSRRASAATSEEAFEKIMQSFDTDPKLVYIFQEAHEAGLTPLTEIEEIYRIPWWKTLLPWKKPGICLYPAED